MYFKISFINLLNYLWANAKDLSTILLNVFKNGPSDAVSNRKCFS